MDCELGLFVKCPHPEMIEAMGIAGMDFAVLDMEHTPLGQKDLYPLVLAAERRGLKTIVRIPEKSESYIKWCRDLNVSAIQIPHVETVEDALFAIKASSFNPIGQRGLCRFVRAADFSGLDKTEYLERANLNNHLILQIEGVKAFDNLHAILEVLTTNISIFIGPYDLSQSMGKPGQIWDTEVVDKMKQIIKKCSEKSIKVGTFTDTVEGIHFWQQKGVAFVEYASDLNLFMDSVRKLSQSL